ncbi:hypothetical protein [Anaerostipes caccae]|uniref:hypothetical protein n=1 Tax=Anaerostipes caccae TaxID=105841 RepID=UPI001D06CC8F|nr:hypothetical protein [Anaerostipes caccae]MCB6293809.1 hypothetical protein [Anaerostipes caccae]MCB6336438.1 hypothetical protein [Anaerostipes caccae]MCB6339542.1 hypothetical protein [Anaerostipes caccae]MCB6351532.1 hypothetical protein [Anaerostipes caccae]MCB6359843.1 hypothetical protein [Anaerostipes caccae]
MSKVKITQSYYDKKLGFFKDPNDDLEVSDERAAVLVEAGVAELVVPETANEEKPKGKRKPNK